MGHKTIVYYPSSRGDNPVLSFLLSLGPDEQQKTLAYLSYLEEQGEALRRPIAEYLGDRLYELRPKHIRLLYTFVGKSLAVVLHAFRKTTSAVPQGELLLALSRRVDFLDRYERGLISIKR